MYRLATTQASSVDKPRCTTRAPAGCLTAMAARGCTASTTRMLQARGGTCRLRPHSAKSENPSGGLRIGARISLPVTTRIAPVFLHCAITCMSRTIHTCAKYRASLACRWCFAQCIYHVWRSHKVIRSRRRPRLVIAIGAACDMVTGCRTRGARFCAQATPFESDFLGQQ